MSEREVLTFVGGGADGTTREVEAGRRQYAVPILETPDDEFSLMWEPVDGTATVQYRVDEYTRRTIRSGVREVEYFGLVSLSDAECIERLVGGYGRRTE